MKAFEMLLGGNYGEPPKACRISYGLPKNRQEHIVPVEYRAILALIVEARSELSRNLRSHEKDCYQLSSFVEQKASELNSELFRLVSNPAAIAIEYHSDWKFSALTSEDIVREH